MRGCRPLSDAEIEAITQQLETQRDRALFILGVKSGFRISELLSLKVSDVQQYGEIVDRVYIARRHMKRKLSGRQVPLHAAAKHALGVLIGQARLEPHHYLFKSREGANRPLTRSQAWRVLKHATLGARVQGKVATHSMRKTFAAKVYRAVGRDLVKLQQALGHHSISSTVSYLSFDQAEIDDAILGG